MPSRIPPGRLRASTASTPRSSRTSSTSIDFSFRTRAAAARRRSCRRATSRSSTTSPARCARFAWCRTAIREATLTLVGAGSEEERLRALAERARPAATCASPGRVAPDDIWRYYADADIYLQTPDIDNMPLVGARGLRERVCGRLDQRRRRPGDSDRRPARPARRLRRPRRGGAIGSSGCSTTRRSCERLTAARPARAAPVPRGRRVRATGWPSTTGLVHRPARLSTQPTTSAV